MTKSLSSSGSSSLRMTGDNRDRGQIVGRMWADADPGACRGWQRVSVTYRIRIRTRRDRRRKENRIFVIVNCGEAGVARA
jgi:hypothetical protein